MIGLGSTGGRILRDLRKLVRQEFPAGRGDPVDADGHNSGANIGYLYVDSDGDALKERESWRVLGESVQLDVNQRRLIRDGQLGGAVRNLDLFPAVKPWIGDPIHLQEVFRAVEGAQGAGQIRRFGRFLFANSAGIFEQDITAGVGRLQKAGAAQVAFHISGTLAGGTGSGSLIDAALIIRNRYPDAENYPIFLYVLATSEPVGGQVDKANFYANQYATLMELGPFVLNDIHPHLLTSNGQRGESCRERFQACYIITNRNQNNRDLTLEDQQQLVAEYLFHRAVTLQGRDGAICNAWTYQDSGQFTTFRKRTARFNSPGVKRWVVPTVEMREKVAMSLGASGVAQVLYNNWVQDHGYRMELRPLDLPSEVAKSDEATSWRLAEDQIMLNHGFELAASQGQETAWDIEWKRVMSAFVTEVRTASPQAPVHWLGEIQRRTDDHMAKGFRQRGIEQWFRDKKSSAKDYAVAIRQTVETDLFTRWRNGVLGLHDVRRIIEALREEVDRRLRIIDSEITQLEEEIRNGEHYLKKAHSEWAALGLWAKILKLFGTDVRARMLQSFEQRMLKLCLVRTRRAVTDFKTTLLQATLGQLDDLRDIIALAAQSLEDSQRAMQKKADDRCPRGEQRLFEKRHVREYEPETVEQVTKDLGVSQPAQQSFGARLRSEMEQSVSPHPDFRKLRKFLGDGELPGLVDRCAYESAEAQIQILAGQGRYTNILKAGIIETLRDRYANDPSALQRDVEKFVEWSAAAYKLAPTIFQPNSDNERRHWPRMPMRIAAVFLPINEHTNDPFETRLRSLFQRATSDATVVFVYTNRNQEITVLTTDYLLPAHFFRTVVELKQKYDDRCQGNPVAARSELHIEDWQVDQLPDLLINPSEAASWTSPAN